MTSPESERDPADDPELVAFVKATDARVAQFVESLGKRHSLKIASARSAFELLDNGDERTFIVEGLAFSVVSTKNGTRAEVIVRWATKGKEELYHTVLGDAYTVRREEMEKRVLPMIDQMMVLDDLGRIC